MLKDEFLNLNNLLRNNYNKIGDVINRNSLKNFGDFYMTKALNKDELNAFMPNGVASVDGSINKYGGNDPHVLHLLSAVFLPDLERERITNYNILSPLTSPDINPTLELSKLELEVAISGINTYDSRAVIMDGGFVRYAADAESEYQKLLELAKSRGTLLFGVIEDIKSSSISKALNCNYFDREAFFGLLDEGEVFFLKDEYNQKNESDISTFYIRPGKNPLAIGVDYPNFLNEKKELIANLLVTITAKNSRGIPIILDYVDKFSKVTNKDIELYVKSFLDDDLRRVFFDEVRQMRWL